MDKIILGIGVACIILGILAVLFQNRKQRQITDRLRKMIEAAEQSRFDESRFDESVCSALESEMADYLAASEAAKEESALEKEKIQTLIADISHQTKTPIANLLLYTELLSERETDRENREYVEAIQKQAEKLNFLIRSLIKMSRLETGIITLCPRQQDVKELLDDVVDSYREKAAAKGLELMNLAGHESACFDRKWTAEALGNLLDNAVKYTSAGQITVRTKRYELFTSIEVEDTGNGLEEKEIPEIFHRFRRGGEVRDQEGVGIGLYLAREILSGERGYIKVSSEKDKGSVFAVFLPNCEKGILSELS